MLRVMQMEWNGDHTTLFFFASCSPKLEKGNRLNTHLNNVSTSVWMGRWGMVNIDQRIAELVQVRTTKCTIQLLWAFIDQ